MMFNGLPFATIELLHSTFSPSPSLCVWFRNLVVERLEVLPDLPLTTRPVQPAYTRVPF